MRQGLDLVAPGRRGVMRRELAAVLPRRPPPNFFVRPARARAHPAREPQRPHKPGDSSARSPARWSPSTLGSSDLSLRGAVARPWLEERRRKQIFCTVAIAAQRAARCGTLRPKLSACWRNVMFIYTSRS